MIMSKRWDWKATIMICIFCCGLMSIFFEAFSLSSVHTTNDNGNFLQRYMSYMESKTNKTDVELIIGHILQASPAFSNISLNFDDDDEDSNSSLNPPSSDPETAVSMLINLLVHVAPGFVIDASSRKKTWFRDIPLKLQRKVYSFACHNANVSAFLKISCDSKNEPSAPSIDDVLLNGEERIPTRGFLDVSVLFVDGNGAVALRKLQGSSWTMQMHRVPFIVVSLEARKQKAAEILQMLHSGGYKVYIFNENGFDEDEERLKHCNVVTAINIVAAARKPYGLLEELSFSKCEITESDVKKTVARLTASNFDQNSMTKKKIHRSRRRSIQIIAVRTDSLVRPRDPYWYAVAWDIDNEKNLWQQTPLKRNMRRCQSADEKMMTCDFYPLKMAIVLGINNSSSAISEIGHWWPRYRACAEGGKYQQHVDLILRVVWTPDVKIDEFIENIHRAMGINTTSSSDCVGNVSIDWIDPQSHKHVDPLAANMDLDALFILPLFRLLRDRYDYFFFLRPETRPMKPNWIDLLYENLLVFPEHFWHNGPLLGNIVYIPEARHFDRRIMTDPFIEISYFPRSCIGYYRLNDKGFTDDLNFTKFEHKASTMQYLMFHALRSGINTRHWLTTRKNWMLTETVIDSPPAFQVANFQSFSDENPNAVVANNVMEYRVKCFGLEATDTTTIATKCTSAGFQECLGCDGKNSSYLNVKSNAAWYASATAPPKHLNRTCQIKTDRYSKTIQLVSCHIPTESLAVVLPINHNKNELEVFQLLSNWTGQQYPCDVRKKYGRNIGMHFISIPTLDRSISDYFNREVQQILESSNIARECTRSVSFEDAVLPSNGENNYKWATCSHFFPNFVDAVKTSQYSYMLFTEEDVSPVKPMWLDIILETISLYPEHFWQIGSLGRYLSKYGEYDDHRNGVAIYRLGDPWFDAIIKKASAMCPGAHDRMLDFVMTESAALMSKTWYKFICTDLHQNQPAAYELFDLGWFNQRYPDTVIVHKYNRVILNMCPTTNQCEVPTFQGGYS